MSGRLCCVTMIVLGGDRHRVGYQSVQERDGTADMTPGSEAELPTGSSAAVGPNATPAANAQDSSDDKGPTARRMILGDRKSTRLNSSHVKISYAVFCLKKENTD